MPDRTPPKRLRRKSNSGKSQLNWDARYGKNYKRVCAITHRQTSGFCCYCLSAKSKEIHHALYGNDVAGFSIFAVCDKCHKRVCHSRQNWIKDKNNPVWKNRNTEEFISRLRLGFELLNIGIN
ncbi:MAG: hypothetical protein KME52_18400 [Desmonostoc geniculatum HA4340-LM1]|nr:hypothetical protein [Desmonostoc geniculatum HA4340-LM1]